MRKNCLNLLNKHITNQRSIELNLIISHISEIVKRKNIFFDTEHCSEIFGDRSRPRRVASLAPTSQGVNGQG